MEKNDIIERIGYLRVRARLTQRALSCAIGMNPNYINRLESKKDFLPSVEVLIKIIHECGSTEEEFFYHSIKAYEHDAVLKRKLDLLPDDVKRFLLSCDDDLLELFLKVNRKIISNQDK